MGPSPSNPTRLILHGRAFQCMKAVTMSSNLEANLEAAQSGDRRKALEVARDTAARALDAAALKGDGTVAQILAQYRATLAEIAELEPMTGASARERFAARVATSNTSA